MNSAIIFSSIFSILGAATLVTSYWDQFWFQFQYQTVVSVDCRRQDWVLIDFNERVPVESGVCYNKEPVPKGEFNGNKLAFVGKLGPSIEMNIGIEYKFKFIDPVRYMKALSNTARQTAARMTYEPTPSVWELAKELFIDRVVLEIASSPEVLQANGIGDASLSNMEDRVRRMANSRLSVQGIIITSVSTQ